MDKRIESQIVGTKITPPRDRQHKNNSPKEGTDGELNSRHEKDLPKGWMAEE